MKRQRTIQQFGLMFFLLISIVCTPLSSLAQSEQRVTLHLKNATVEQVIKEIKQTTRYNFIYRVEDLSSTPSRNYDFDKATLKEVMDKLVAGTSLSWSIQNGTVVIKKQIEKSQPVKLKLRGTIHDKTGLPLPGVSVVVKGTTIGVASGADGSYSLEVPESENLILAFNFVGMKSQEIPYEGNTKIDVVMDDDSKAIDEVVVTGYFDKAKSGFTGNASSFTSDQLRAVNPTNLLAALSVLDPSFKMIENNSAGSNPNVIPNYQIRGSSSMPSAADLKSSLIGDPNMPTFILDGFEVSAEKVFDMDPMRIEKMTILKDAAATAIYGSRASNGVVVINTKQPEAGKIRVIYNVDMSMSMADLSDYDLLNASEKLQLEKASGYFDPFGTIDQSEVRERDYNYRLGLVQKGYDTYWLNKPLHSVVIGHKHSLSVEGGENSMRYALDVSYEDAPGVMKESGRNRLGMGSMLLYRFKRVTFKNNMTYDHVKSQNTPYGSFSQYARLNPYYPYLDEQGRYIKELEEYSGPLGRDRAMNPLYNTQLNTIDESSYSQFINNFGIDWFVTDEFRVKANFAIRHKKSDGTVFKPADHTDFSQYSESDFYRRGYYDATTGRETFYDGNVVVSYNTEIGDHALNVNGVWNVQGTSGDIYSVRAEGFPDDRLDYITFAAQNAKSYLPQGEDYVSRLMGFVGNVSYGYKDRYLADASIRFDGSSKFGAKGRWATFASIGAGWNVHKEAFAENWRGINVLKLRASFGRTGSQSFDPYQSFIMYRYYTQRRYQNSIGAVMMGLGNPSLKWQQTDQLNAAIDVEFWKNRLSFTANVYQNMSKNLLTDITLAPSLGYDTYKENLGQIENRGYELEMKATVLRTKNSWLTLTASGVHNKNILKKISNSLRAWNEAQNNSETNLNVPKVLYVEGESINAIWGVPSLGINPASGKEIFLAADGSRVDTWNAADQRVLGNYDPKLRGNLGINGGWKGFQMNVYFTYEMGGDTYNTTLVERVENADKRYNTDRRVLSGRWQKPGDATFFKDIKDNTATKPTSRFVEKNNYLQMSSLNLSYDFPQSFVKKMRMESLRLSFSMNDVLRLSTVKMERGLDYPFARTFRTSLRITF